MATRVQDHDRGARALLERMELLERGVRVTVGVHDDVGALPHAGGSTIAEVAAVTELGSHVERPHSFVRSAVDDAGPRIARDLADAGAAVLGGAPVEEAFGVAGERLADDMRRRVPVETGETRAAIGVRVELG